MKRRTVKKHSRKTRKSGLGKRRLFSFKMKGGDQPALIGSPYTPDNLPGQAGISGVSNYYPYNNYTPFDPQTENILQGRDQTTLGTGYKGGRKTKKSCNCGIKLGGMKHRSMKHSSMKHRSMKHRMSKRGGGFLPQDLVNLGRSITYSIGSTYNAINGYPAPVNPIPYMDQLKNTK
jgi:hypothetical protein